MTKDFVTIEKVFLHLVTKMRKREGLDWIFYGPSCLGLDDLHQGIMYILHSAPLCGRRAAWRCVSAAPLGSIAFSGLQLYQRQLDQNFADFSALLGLSPPWLAGARHAPAGASLTSAVMVGPADGAKSKATGKGGIVASRRCMLLDQCCRTSLMHIELFPSSHTPCLPGPPGRTSQDIVIRLN